MEGSYTNFRHKQGESGDGQDGRAAGGEGQGKASPASPGDGEEGGACPEAGRRGLGRPFSNGFREPHLQPSIPTAPSLRPPPHPRPAIALAPRPVAPSLRPPALPSVFAIELQAPPRAPSP